MAIWVPSEDRPCPALIHVGLTKMASKSSTAFGLGAMRVTGTCGCGPDTEVPQMAVQQRNGNRDGQMHLCP